MDSIARSTFAAMIAAIAASALAADWTALNDEARKESMTVIRPGELGKAPFWNGCRPFCPIRPAAQLRGRPWRSCAIR